MNINLFIVMAFGSKLPESHYFFNHGQSTIQWLVVLFWEYAWHDLGKSGDLDGDFQ